MVRFTLRPHSFLLMSSKFKLLRLIYRKYEMLELLIHPGEHKLAISESLNKLLQISIFAEVSKVIKKSLKKYRVKFTPFL